VAVRVALREEAVTWYSVSEWRLNSRLGNLLVSHIFVVRSVGARLNKRRFGEKEKEEEARAKRL
jgi:hypothetical protein